MMFGQRSKSRTQFALDIIILGLTIVIIGGIVSSMSSSAWPTKLFSMVAGSFILTFSYFFMEDQVLSIAKDVQEQNA